MPTYTNRDLPGGAGWRERKLPGAPSAPDPMAPSPLPPYKRDKAERDFSQPDPVAGARAWIDKNPLEVGTRQTKDGVTGEWNGKTWMRVEEEAEPQPKYYGPTGYIAEAAQGLVESPKDALAGLLRMPGQIYKGYTEDIPALIRDPSLLQETPAMLGDMGSGLVDTVKNDPRAVGSAVGQLLLAHKAPAMARGAMAKVPGAARSVAGAVAKPLEMAGEHMGQPGIQGAMIGGSLMHGNVPGAIAASVGPRIMSAAGRGLRKFASSESEMGGPPIPVPSGLGMNYAEPMTPNPAYETGRARPMGGKAYPMPASSATETPVYEMNSDGLRYRPPTDELAGTQNLREWMLNQGPELPSQRKAVMDPGAQASQLKQEAAYGRAGAQDPVMQARRRAAIDALMNLDSFQGLR